MRFGDLCSQHSGFVAGRVMPLSWHIGCVMPHWNRLA
jgi:hypothetical protein